MDKNMVKYMIEEQQKDLETSQKELAASQKELETSRQEVEEKDAVILQLMEEIQRLKQQS